MYSVAIYKKTVISLVDRKGKEAYESNVRGFFLCCPLCGNDKINAFLPSLSSGGRDTLTCETCGAKWHLRISALGLSWAELELSSKDGRGQELIGKRLKGAEWRELAQKARVLHPLPSINVANQAVNEKEIIREKEVIVKIRCPYCHSLFAETLEKCPNCGAKN